MANIIVINPFEVPKGKEEQALAMWDRLPTIFAGSRGTSQMVSISPAHTSLSLVAAATVLLSMLSSQVVARADTPIAQSINRAPSIDTRVRYRTVEIDGIKLFYREAGPADAPVVVLLHGFPASSFMYRALIEQLAGQFHLIAPDYPGFGYSDAPSAQAFSYTFDHLADIIEKFTDRFGLDKYALYMQDFGGPVGFRLASRHPDRVSALIVQNANAYEEGLSDSFWKPVRALWQDPTPANFDTIREAAMSDAALEWNYTHGVREPARINPDSWVLQRTLVNRPGNKDIMLALLYDYRANLGQYNQWHEYFRKYHPPTLIVWGINDSIFPAEGARAYLRDLPRAELHLLDTGHFALEDKGDEIARLMLDFLDRTLPRRKLG
jgi:pimeloyl-ACP methyl ester carboxylesterase